MDDHMKHDDPRVALPSSGCDFTQQEIAEAPPVEVRDPGEDE